MEYIVFPFCVPFSGSEGVFFFRSLMAGSSVRDLPPDVSCQFCCAASVKWSNFISSNSPAPLSPLSVTAFLKNTGVRFRSP